MKVIGFEEHYKLPAIQAANRDNPGELVFDVWKKAGRFETDAQGGWPYRIEQLVGDADGALPISQDVRISRLVTDDAKSYVYKPRSVSHGVYVYVLEGEVRIGETRLGRRDGAGLWDFESMECEVTADASDVLFVETVMADRDQI